MDKSPIYRKYTYNDGLYLNLVCGHRVWKGSDEFNEWQLRADPSAPKLVRCLGCEKGEEIAPDCKSLKEEQEEAKTDKPEELREKIATNLASWKDEICRMAEGSGKNADSPMARAKQILSLLASMGLGTFEKMEWPENPLMAKVRCDLARYNEKFPGHTMKIEEWLEGGEFLAPAATAAIRVYGLAQQDIRALVGILGEFIKLEVKE